MNKTLPKAPYGGELKVGDLRIPCYVLEDETRVLSQRGMQSTVGMSKGGGSKVGVRRLTALVESFESKGIKIQGLMARLNSPLIFQPTHGGRSAYGYEATVLTDFCEFILRCRDAGLLKTDKQKYYAQTADLILRGLAQVGIIALIDEATGFQDNRVKNALEKILNAYLLKEKKPYIGMFPLWFYKEIYRLNGWRWSPENAQKRPGVIGRWTNELIYGKMAPGLVKRLQRLNPAISPGRRAFKHLQLLTDEVGDPALRAHFAGLGALMRASTQWRKFRALVEKAYPDPNKTLELELGYHEK